MAKAKKKRTKKDPNELSGRDLQGALRSIEGLMQGKKVKRGRNPLINSLMDALEDNGLAGYARGRELTEAELRELPLGTVIWILYCKDDNPDNVRFDGAYRITAKDNDACGNGAFETHTGEDWTFDGDTSRGQAHYFVAEESV